MEDQENDREADVRYALDNWACPKCDGELECKSRHERDSTYDSTGCTKCSWYYYDFETWDMS